MKSFKVASVIKQKEEQEEHNGVDGPSSLTVSTISLMQSDTVMMRGHHQVVNRGLMSQSPSRRAPIAILGNWNLLMDSPIQNILKVFDR